VFTRCANPACERPFDHRQGKFFRFPRGTRDGELPPNTHSVQHFWLCGDCCEIYTLSYRNDEGVVITPLLETASRREVPRLVTVG